MNNRIKEFEKQCWESSQYEPYALFDPTKFAQLIVRECAEVIFKTPVEYTEIDTMHRIRDRVKQHFGVEE